jgi:hypothetical protein
MSDSDWLLVCKENEAEYMAHFEATFCNNVLGLVRDLVRIGVSDDEINFEVLPKISVTYQIERAKELQRYRAMCEKNRVTKH